MTRRAIALLLAMLELLLPAWASLAQAQTPTTSPSLLEALRQIQSGNQSSSDVQALESPQVTWSVEAPVDPATYRVLPGDGMNLGVWGEVAKTWALRVSPEGDIVVPVLGPAHIGGLTLVEAEALLRRSLEPLYPRARVTLRLVEPGRFRVSVAGLVARPGIYEATASDRLSMALTAAGGIRAGASIRAIRLTPLEGGETQTVDLVPWLLRGDSSSNPTLSPGVSIEVPLRGPTVRVRGPVQGRTGLELTPDRGTRIADRPDEEPDLVIEWQEGDSVALLIAAAGGLNDHATGNGTLFREGEDPIELDLSSRADLARPLRANDLLDVEYAVRWVYITGAVRSAGRYPYLPGMRALDYVAMAGGPTELGRATSWTYRDDEGKYHSLDALTVLEPGDFVRVPERRTYRLASILAPLSSATAVVLSIIAIARR